LVERRTAELSRATERVEEGKLLSWLVERAPPPKGWDVMVKERRGRVCAICVRIRVA
jgi:hypothetical protein